MLILGLTKTTLLDFPGHVAAALFTGGCNFRCPYCHNRDIVLKTDAAAPLAEEDIFSFLDKRRNVLEGVCITGGEPTLHDDKEKGIRRVRKTDGGGIFLRGIFDIHCAVVNQPVANQGIQHIRVCPIRVKLYEIAQFFDTSNKVRQVIV